MAEEIRVVPKALADNELRTPIDDIRATSNASATAVSGHTILTSATVRLVAVGGSNVIRIHMLNMQAFNNDAITYTCIFRDGGFTGPTLFGPFKVLANNLVTFNRDDLIGRAAYSSIELVILSAQTSVPLVPVSNGVTAQVGFVIDRLDLRE